MPDGKKWQEHNFGIFLSHLHIATKTIPFEWQNQRDWQILLCLMMSAYIVPEHGLYRKGLALYILNSNFDQIRWNTIGVIHQTMSTNIGHLYFICNRPYLGCPRTVQSYYPMELWDDRRRWLNTSTAIWVWPMMYFNQDFFNLESCFVFCALLYGAFASTRSWEASSYPLRPCVRFPGPPRPNCWIIDSSLVYLLQDTRSSTWFGPCGPPLVDDCFLDRCDRVFCANGTTVPSFWKNDPALHGIDLCAVLPDFFSYLLTYSYPRRTSYIVLLPFV